MIEWIKDKFSTLVSVCFVLFVVMATVIGGLIGFGISKLTIAGTYYFKAASTVSSAQIPGILIGAGIGLVIGLLLGIMIFGFMATVIDISETENGILLKLVSFQNDTEKNLKKLTETENDILNFISDLKSKINRKENNLPMSSSKEKEEIKTAESDSAKDEEDEYIIVRRNGRLFAYKDDNLFCTKCHAFIDSEMKSMCPNCGTSLME